MLVTLRPLLPVIVDIAPAACEAMAIVLAPPVTGLYNVQLPREFMGADVRIVTLFAIRSVVKQLYMSMSLVEDTVPGLLS